MNWQKLKDRFFFPLLIFLSAKQSKRIGLTPIDSERVNICLKYVQGKLIDIGCGGNKFVKRCGNGVGVDIYPWSNIDLLADATMLPFKDKTFDTVSFMGSLNHIPKSNRIKALKEANRILKNTRESLMLITMLNPVIGYICHKIRYVHDKDQTQRGMKKSEVWGFWKKDVKRMLRESGFILINTQRFVYGLNTLYIGKHERRN